MQKRTEIDYDFREDLAAEERIRILLKPHPKPQVRFREPEEILRPYLVPKEREQLMQEDFPELLQTRRRGLGKAVR